MRGEPTRRAATSPSLLVRWLMVLGGCRTAAAAIVTKDIVAELLRYNGRVGEGDALDLWEVPKCPVNGGDLIKAGFTKGKALGGALAELREKWIASDYSLTKDALLVQDQ